MNNKKVIGQTPKGDRNDLLKYYNYVKVCINCNTYYGDDRYSKEDFGTCPICSKDAPEILRRLVRGESSADKERD